MSEKPLALGGPIHGSVLPSTLKVGHVWRVPIIAPQTMAIPGDSLPASQNYEIEEYRVHKFFVAHEGVARSRIVAVRDQDELNIGFLLLFHYMGKEAEQ